MNKPFRYILLLFLPLFAAALWPLAREWTQPTVTPSPGNVYNFGPVRSGQTLTHTFTLVNPHLFSVRLQVPPAEGCLCTRAAAETPNIAARGTGKVTVSVEADGRGKQSQSVKVVTRRGGEAAQMWLFVEYDVVKDAGKEKT